MFALCAPAAQPLRLLHISEYGADLDASHAIEPLTLCGLPMCAWDQWITVQHRAGDRLCPVCVDTLGQGALALLGLLEEVA